MFQRIRAAWAALTAPATSTPAPSTGPDTHIPHPDDYPTRAAWAAAVQATADHMRATEETTNTTRDVHDGGRALQAHHVQDLSMDTHTHTHEDTHHHGGTVTNNNHGGTVGLQAGHVNGGIINMGGTNSFTNTVLGSNTNYVGTNNGGQVIQGDITGGVSFGDPHR